MGHQNPAIIGIKWDGEGRFLHHFLPTIGGNQPQEDVEMNTRLRQYFGFATNVWIEFAPRDYSLLYAQQDECSSDIMSFAVSAMSGLTVKRLCDPEYIKLKA
jgi:hypothetical protein